MTTILALVDFSDASTNSVSFAAPFLRDEAARERGGGAGKGKATGADRPERVAAVCRTRGAHSQRVARTDSQIEIRRQTHHRLRRVGQRQHAAQYLRPNEARAGLHHR